MARGLGKNRRGFANSSVITTVVTTPGSSNVALYLPFDSDLNDDSTNAFTGTAVNSASISTSVKKFGSGSLDLVSSGKYVNYPYNSDFDLGSDNWTFEAWIYLTTSDDASVFSQYAGQGGGSDDYNYAFKIHNSTPRQIQFFWNGGDGHGWSLDAAINVWNHVALVREGNSVHAFLNGVKGSGSANLSGTIRSLGSDNFSVGRSALDGYRGYIDDFRFIKGFALYTSNFTPPTSSIGLTGGLEVTNTTVETKFLSSVWSLKDQNKKISKGEWIRNDAVDTGANAKGRSIKGAGLQVDGHRHFTGPGVVASGGSEITTPTHQYHVFTGPGNFTMTGTQGQVEYLVIGGGGAGGRGNPGIRQGGGGGAGGIRQGTLDPLTPGTYPITVGTGGNEPGGSTGDPPANADGNDSTFATITSAGGGAGGNGDYNPHQDIDGRSGGSGGGGASEHHDHTGSGGSGNNPPTTPPQGNPGNPAGQAPSNQYYGGGGGSLAGGSTIYSLGDPASPFPQFNSTILAPAIPSNLETAISTSGNFGGGGQGAMLASDSGPLGPYIGRAHHPDTPSGAGYGGSQQSPPSSERGQNAVDGSGAGGGASMSGQTAGNGGDGIVIIRYET